MRIVKWIGVVLALLIVAVVVAALTVDVNRFKPQIVAAAENATGRKLEIAEDMKLSLWPLGIGVKRVSFANAAWGSRPQMATIGEFTAQIDLPSLIGGQVRVDSLVLSDVDILLEKDRQGRANWEFGTEKPAPAQQPQSQPAQSGGSGTLPELENVSLKNVKLTYRDAQAGSSTDVNLKEFSIKKASGGLLATKLVAVVNGNDITADGTLGSLDHLMAPTAAKPWPVRLQVTVPGAKASVEGSIAQPTQAKGIALKVAADIPDLAKLAAPFGASAPAVPLTLQADVKDVAPQRYALSNIGAKIADSDLAGSAEINLAGAKPAIRADLASKLMDVTKLIPKGAGNDGKGGPAPTASGKPVAKSGDGRLFSNDPLPLDGLNAADAQITYKAEQFKAPSLDAQTVSLNIVLKDGVLNVKPGVGALAQGSLNGDITLNGKSKTLNAKLDGKGVVLSEYLQKAGITDIVRRGAPTDLALDVSSQGGSLRQLMAGLNGKMVLKVGEGELKEEYMREFLPGLARSVAALDKATAKTKLQCVVAGLDIKNGVVTPKAILAETGSFTMTGDGTANLGTEQLDLRLVPSSRDTGLAAALPPVRVRGQMADPSFTPDTAALAKNVLGTAAGYAALGPLALLSPALGSGGDDAATACSKAVALAEGRPVPASSSSGGTQQQQQQQPQSNSPVDNIKRLFGR